MKGLALKFKFSHSYSTKRSTRVNDPSKYKYALLVSPEFASSTNRLLAWHLYADLNSMA